MKKIFLVLFAVCMVATTFGQTIGQQTITFMNCLDCDNYYEPNVNTIDMVGLILSADTIYEAEDYNGIREVFYGEFPAVNIPNLSNVFLSSDDSDILAIVIQSDFNGETRAMYLLTCYGWLQSVDMQDFRFFDKLLLLFRYPNPKQQILKKSEPFRGHIQPSHFCEGFLLTYCYKYI